MISELSSTSKAHELTEHTSSASAWLRRAKRGAICWLRSPNSSLASGSRNLTFPPRTIHRCRKRQQNIKNRKNTAADLIWDWNIQCKKQFSGKGILQNSEGISLVKVTLAGKKVNLWKHIDVGKLQLHHGWQRCHTATDILCHIWHKLLPGTKKMTLEQQENFTPHIHWFLGYLNVLPKLQP